jgi:hypothetical protein
MDELPNSSIAGAVREDVPETRMEGTLARAVTIGEDGPRLNACGADGIVRGPGGDGSLVMRAAPFGEAKATAMLAKDARVHVCTRSIDQRWLGVVVEPIANPTADNAMSNVQDTPATDCGVSGTVESKKAYAGPCQSGWVASDFVQLVAG